MAITNEEYVGSKIKNIIVSSNICKTEYDTSNGNLLVTFNNGLIYEYYEVPHSLYTKFRFSESQGKFFMKNISKNFRYKRIIEE